MEELQQALATAFGVRDAELDAVTMPLRAVVVYLSALLIVRLGEKRFFGKNTAFDLILGIIFGSVVSRAINGSAELLPTLLAGAALIGAHWLLAVIAFRYSAFGTLIKGRPRVLVRDGEIDRSALGRSHLSENDLATALREEAGVDDISQVREARLERSGNISVMTRNRPQVIDVQIEEGVQTVRVRLE